MQLLKNYFRIYLWKKRLDLFQAANFQKERGVKLQHIPSDFICLKKITDA